MSEAEVEARRQRLEAYFRAGSTALMHASALGHDTVVAQLLAAGADAAPVDADGQSALCHAVAAGCSKCVAMLLEARGGLDASAPPHISPHLPPSPHIPPPTPPPPHSAPHPPPPPLISPDLEALGG